MTKICRKQVLCHASHKDDKRISPLRDALKGLGERERSIITMRYFENRTQTEIAESLGISQAQVSRIEKAALAKMKKKMT